MVHDGPLYTAGSYCHIHHLTQSILAQYLRASRKTVEGWGPAGTRPAARPAVSELLERNAFPPAAV
ncbi:MAG: hypothetical protein IIZ54_04305 [Selenomonadaceae bacterium]|nr:hypothetical protein [Selenomonadaceae bacterium]